MKKEVKKPPVKEIHFKAEVNNLQVPYLIFNDKKAVLIAGNNSDKDIEIRLEVSFEDTPFQANDVFRITDLWNDNKTKLISAENLLTFKTKIKADKTRRGGLGVWKIEPVR